MQIAKARKMSLCFLEGEFCIDCILSSILFLAFLALWPPIQHSTTKPKSDITALNFLTFFVPTLPLNCPIILTFVSAFLCLDENVEKSEHFQALIGFEINDRCWQHRKDAFLYLQGRSTKIVSLCPELMFSILALHRHYMLLKKCFSGLVHEGREFCPLPWHWAQKA